MFSVYSFVVQNKYFCLYFHLFFFCRATSLQERRLDGEHAGNTTAFNDNLRQWYIQIGKYKRCDDVNDREAEREKRVSLN